jgi:Kef-type K+ transport system membrane component KefB
MGSPWRDAALIGVLLNTRGLVELVVLNIGLDLGILSPVLFSMMVMMALATTLATSPLVSLIVARTRPANTGSLTLVS